ncbi:CRIB domain-containing protein RIC1, partial [Linum grandiflorum]
PFCRLLADEKEQEIEIGFPTDVKHVAHIGSDGPSSTTPSWMNEFKSTPETMSGPLNPTDDLKSLPSPTKAQSEAAGGSTHRKHRSRRSSSDAPKHARRGSNASSAAGSPVGSPKAGDGEKKSRRHRSSNNLAMGSPARETSTGGSVKARKSKKSSSSSANQGDESPPSVDQPSIPKHSRTRKSRARSKEQQDNSAPADALPPTADGASTKSNTAGHLTSVLDAYQEER